MIRQSQRFLTQLYALADFICIQFAFGLAWWLKFQSGWLDHGPALPFQHYLAWSVAYGVIAVIVGYMTVLYSPKRRKKFSYEVYKIFQVHIIAMMVLFSLLFVYREIHLSREFLALFFMGNVLLVGGYRFLVKRALQRFRQKGYNKQFVLIIGAGSLGRRFYKNLRKHPELGYDVIGFLDDYMAEHEEPCDRPIIGTIDDLERVLEEEMIDEVIIALPLDAHKKYGQIINTCEKAGAKAHIIPDYYDYLPAKPFFDHFAGIPIINVRDVPLDELRSRLIKRVFDIVFSLFALLITSPILLVIAVVIKLTSRGPIIFKQERVGKNRRPFMMYKFRTMRIEHDEVAATGWTVRNDPRTTRFGRVLRRLSLDELPQFYNVLKGDMSVVGPRPERPHFVDQFKEEVPRYMIKHHIRPGITGWAQSQGLRGDTSIEERIEHDVYYIENWSFALDMKIIFKTMTSGFRDSNAY